MRFLKSQNRLIIVEQQFIYYKTAALASIFRALVSFSALTGFGLVTSMEFTLLAGAFREQKRTMV